MEKLLFSIRFEKLFNRVCFEEQTAQLLSQLKHHHEYTYLHSLRVAHYSYQIASYLGQSESERIVLTRSALLHDIGKLCITEKLLNKTSKLTMHEFELLKMHPRFGIETLESSRYANTFDPDVILYHHENLDGTGYPIGLDAKSLSTNVRIVRVADSFDAMTTRRSYNTVKKIGEAMTELYCYKHKNFDSNVLGMLNQYLEEKILTKVGV